MTALFAPTVLARGGGRALEKITSLNIWSGGINDVTLLRLMPSLEIISLPSNMLTDAAFACFGACPALRELYVRDNAFSGALSALAPLGACTQLTHVWIGEPVSTASAYAPFLTRLCPTLTKIDQLDVPQLGRRAETPLAPELEALLLSAPAAARSGGDTSPPPPRASSSGISHVRHELIVLGASGTTAAAPLMSSILAAALVLIASMDAPSLAAVTAATTEQQQQLLQLQQQRRVPRAAVSRGGAAAVPRSS